VFKRFLFFATLVPLVSFGQRFEFGAKAGVPLSETFETGSLFHIGSGEGSTSATRRYTVGPTVELKLWHGFSAEFDVLYRRVGFNELQENSVFELAHTRTTANSWEFPIAGKFRILHLPVLSPFIDGGVSFRRISGVSSSIVEVPDDAEPRRSTGSTSTTLDHRSSRGAVVGVGANIHAWVLHISPEIRYTRWGADRNLDPLLNSNQNQVDLLLGFTF
jgi:hypothetical protein